MSSGTTVPPPILWAQRNDLLLLTVSAECKDVDYKFTETTMYFKGSAVVDNKTYEVTLNFLNEINPEKVTCKNIGRCLEFTIHKKESGPYWSTLTSDKKKPHFLKVDFNKWVDEDDLDSEFPAEPMSSDQYSLEHMLSMRNSDNKPVFDDFDDEEDSDDDPPVLQTS